MKRRDFATVAAGTAAFSITVGTATSPAHLGSKSDSKVEMGKKFQLKFAPHAGHFKHHAGIGYLDQLKFAAEVGFTAWEDIGMMGRPIGQQEKVAEVINDRGLTMGVFMGYASFRAATFADPNTGSRKFLKARMKQVIACAKRMNARWTAIVPGTFVDHLEWDDQTANVVETLQMCAEILEPEGIVMVLEPLNSTKHPRCFLSKVSQAFQICEAVGSPSCKILADLHHQEIAEGNLIANLDQAWSELACLQVGDHPGRKEPGIGGINYSSIFQHLHKKDFQGVIGMEHGISRKGKAGEVKLIQAYRDADHFDPNQL
ncbi:MAG: hydroxypyruvate isomerase family protein [Roseibacillus sp.]